MSRCHGRSVRWDRCRPTRPADELARRALLEWLGTRSFAVYIRAGSASPAVALGHLSPELPLGPGWSAHEPEPRLTGTNQVPIGVEGERIDVQQADSERA